MPERVLTLRELNRTTLLRQLLLRRARVGPGTAIERLGGLQAQFAPSPYIALWSRVERFERDALIRALRRGSVVKGWMMRNTLHLASRRDYAQYAAAFRESRLDLWRRRRGTRISDRRLERLLAFVREAPRTRSEIFAFAEQELGAASERRWVDLVYFNTLGHLEQGHESATWDFRGHPTYTIVDVELPDESNARLHLVRRYLAAFGPASRADLGRWSGLPLAYLGGALDSLGLRRFRDETGRELLDLPRARLAPAKMRAPVRFLPWWDEVLLAYDRRERILPDEYRRIVISKNGDVAPTFLVEGFVAGTWHLDGGRVVTKALEPLPRSARREVETEARRLEAFVR